MRKHLLKFALLLCSLLLCETMLAQTATVKINNNVTYQKITGFGGFVCSGTFAYNHMTTDEIKKLWGKNSEAGYNIMRLYIPTAPATGSRTSAWSQSLATAQLAKSLGIKIFASPWSMPTEWKTNGNIAATYNDANGVAQVGYLKEANYADYANYLNDYVSYLRTNGVELDAISIQNEPDWKATYAGCIFTTAQLAKFVAKYAKLINCKIITPETIGMPDDYANACLPDSVSNEFDIYAGHQYGTIGTRYKNVQAKGHEAWMTEYLINWNADESTSTTTVARNFTWSKDLFNFANKLNSSMLGNINAWIHYASKRFYGLMGDGTFGTTTGVITKRGHILSHYAKYTTGTTRIQNTWNDDSNVLGGSAYSSVTGDSVIVMVINSSGNPYTLTVDLPFYTKSGNSITTTETANMVSAPVSLSAETCRPKVTISPSSFTTLIFSKSNVREVSQMLGSEIHYNKLDNQQVTNVAFGTTYKMSGTKKTFDSSNKLISSNTTNANGYLKLDDQYNQLIFHIDSIKSTGSYTSSSTTLYYVNSSGAVRSYNYGTITFAQSGNFDWILDISRKVLTDGCLGVIGITSGNYSSVLTIKFGDVYLKIGTEKMAKFTGVYSKGDSYMLDCLDGSNLTSLDFSGTSAVPSDQDWNASSISKNCLFYVGSDVANSNTNVVSGSSCSKLTLADGSGNFYVPVNFTAAAATYTRTFYGYGVLTLPFEATVPTGAKAYSMATSTTEVVCNPITKIPANTPVLIAATGTLTFEGTGIVSTPHALKVNGMNGVYIATKAPAGSYYLNTVGVVTAFSLVTTGTEPTIMPFGAYLTPSTAVSITTLSLKLNDVNGIDIIKNDPNADKTIYDILGRRIDQPQKGVYYIRGGRKILFVH